MAGDVEPLVDFRSVFMARVDLENPYIVSGLKAWGSGKYGAAERVSALSFSDGGDAILAGHSHKYFGDPGISGALLLRYDFTAEEFLAQIWEGDGTTSFRALALADDGTVLLTGYAPAAPGSWKTVSGSAEVIPDPNTWPHIEEGSATAESAEAVGQESTPVGTEDTGGGGRDLLVMMVEP
jgi:hypothetical protein